MPRCLVLALMLSSLPLTAQAAEITVQMAGANYEPAGIEARVGDSIIFLNDDTLDHVVFVPTAGHGADLGKQEPGSRKILPLGKAGRFEVECVIHPHMNLVVQVVE